MLFASFLKCLLKVGTCSYSRVTKVKTIYYFLVFDTIIKIITTTKPTRKKAHHIPALNIVSTTPQLLNANNVKKNRNKYSDNFISEFFNKLKIQLLYHFTVLNRWGKFATLKRKQADLYISEKFLLVRKEY